MLFLTEIWHRGNRVVLDCVHFHALLENLLQDEEAPVGGEIGGLRGYLVAVPLEGNDHTRFDAKTGLHVATGYTSIAIDGRGPYVEFLPGQLIWDNLRIPDEEKYRTESSWKDKVFYVEWRTKDQSNVKVYDQKRGVGYADYKVGLCYISPFDLFVEGEAVITKLDSKRKGDVTDLSSGTDFSSEVVQARTGEYLRKGYYNRQSEVAAESAKSSKSRIRWS
jgi:hypothetical protein